MVAREGTAVPPEMFQQHVVARAGTAVPPEMLAVQPTAYAPLPFYILDNHPGLE